MGGNQCSPQRECSKGYAQSKETHSLFGQIEYQICRPCHPSCQACTKPLDLRYCVLEGDACESVGLTGCKYCLSDGVQSECIICKDSGVLDAAAKLCISSRACPEHTFKSEIQMATQLGVLGAFQCSKCPPLCGSCLSDKRCLVCEDKNAFVDSATEVCVCEDGFFYALLNGTAQCHSCHQTCATCRGPSALDCLSCNEKLELGANGTCVCSLTDLQCRLNSEAEQIVNQTEVAFSLKNGLDGNSSEYLIKLAFTNSLSETSFGLVQANSNPQIYDIVISGLFKGRDFDYEIASYASNSTIIVIILGIHVSIPRLVATLSLSNMENLKDSMSRSLQHLNQRRFRFELGPIIPLSASEQDMSLRMSTLMNQLGSQESALASFVSTMRQFNFLFMVLGSMQAINYFIIVKIQHPSLSYIFFQTLTSFNFKNVPNQGVNPVTGQQVFGISVSGITPNQTPATIYSRLGLSASFIVNTHEILIQLIVVWILSVVQKFVFRLLTGKNARFKKIMPIKEFVERRIFVFLGKIHEAVIFQISISVMLQIRQINFDSFWNGFSFVLMVISIIYCTGLLSQLWVSINGTENKLLKYLFSETDDLNFIFQDINYQKVKEQLLLVKSQPKERKRLKQPKSSSEPKIMSDKASASQATRFSTFSYIKMFITVNCHFLNIFKKLACMLFVFAFETNGLQQLSTLIAVQFIYLFAVDLQFPYARTYKSILKIVADCGYILTLIMMVQSEKVWQEIQQHSIIQQRLLQKFKNYGNLQIYGTLIFLISHIAILIMDLIVDLIIVMRPCFSEQVEHSQTETLQISNCVKPNIKQQPQNKMVKIDMPTKIQLVQSSQALKG